MVLMSALISGLSMLALQAATQDAQAPVPDEDIPIEALGPAVGLVYETPWRAGPALAHARAGLAATVIDGRIYTAGGAGLVDPRDDFEVYDPDYGIWSPLPSLPEGLERFAMAEAGGRLYVAGGYSADSGPEPVSTVWSYDPDANIWQSETEMPGAKASFALLSHGEALYALGGEDGMAGMFVYAPETLEWTTLEAPQSVSRRGLAAVILAGEFWLIGGANQGEASASVDIYDPATQTWREGPSLPEPRAGHAAAVVDGVIHVFGGRSADMQRTTSDHLVLEVGATRWSVGQSMPTARTEAAAATIEGEVWLMGGGAGAGFFAPFTAVDSVDVLNPAY